MSKLNRYLFLKKMYPEYVIFILEKDKLITYNWDLKILNILSFDGLININVNYIILDGLDIVFRKEYFDNSYFYYFKICLLREIINFSFNYKC